MVLADGTWADKRGLAPTARLVSYGIMAVEPGMFGLGPVPAVEQALQRAGWDIRSIERAEINEAFATIAIVVARALGLPEDIVNVEGGAVAHGHPIGATGAVLTTKLIHSMRRDGLTRGLVTLCIGGGQVSRLPSKSGTEESELSVVRCSCKQGDQAMPLAKIHVVEGRYDETRIAKVSGAIQAALMNTLRVPPEDFYQIIFEFPKKRFLHTPSFVGMHYTDDLIILDLTFIEGRSKETRLALLKDVNTRVAAAAGVSPDDLMITLYEAPGENFSFGRGEAQRANAVKRA
jgi:acetyl-CoA C-acetyltransferase